MEYPRLPFRSIFTLAALCLTGGAAVWFNMKTEKELEEHRQAAIQGAILKHGYAAGAEAEYGTGNATLTIAFIKEILTSDDPDRFADDDIQKIISMNDKMDFSARRFQEPVVAQYFNYRFGKTFYVDPSLAENPEDVASFIRETEDADTQIDTAGKIMVWIRTGSDRTPYYSMVVDPAVWQYSDTPGVITLRDGKKVPVYHKSHQPELKP